MLYSSISSVVLNQIFSILLVMIYGLLFMNEKSLVDSICINIMLICEDLESWTIIKTKMDWGYNLPNR